MSKNLTQMCADIIAEKDQQIADLEAKLAEKNAEIEDIKDHQKDLCLRCGGLTHIEYEQDKISFCIEKLERLKYNISLDNSDEETGDISYVVDTTFLFELIDRQIEELKKGLD